MATFKTFLIIQCSVALGLGYDLTDYPNRIIGGTEANIEDFPYMAAFLHYGEQFCGASLITNDTIVTAAHCAVLGNINQLTIRVGSSQRHGGGQEISVKQIIIHENYNKKTLDCDVAILKLSEKVNVKNAIPVPLAPANHQYPPGTLGVVTGWGRTIAGKPSDVETLRKVEVPVVEQSECQRAYYGRHDITSRHICAGFKEGGKDSCQQDSGGPYVINGKLAGIVSFGYGCAEPSYPGVYASVPTLGDWIRQHAGI